MTRQGPMQRALADALRSARMPPDDAAAVQLARRYAQLLDDARGTPDEPAVYHTLGPRLLAVLSALGLTRAGRQAMGGGDGRDAAARAVVDELRGRRDRRERRTATVDAAAT